MLNRLINPLRSSTLRQSTMLNHLINPIRRAGLHSRRPDVNTLNAQAYEHWLRDKAEIHLNARMLLGIMLAYGFGGLLSLWQINHELHKQLDANKVSYEENLRLNNNILKQQFDDIGQRQFRHTIQGSKDLQLQARVDADIQANKDPELQAPMDPDIQANKDPVWQAQMDVDIQAPMDPDIQGSKDLELQGHMDGDIQGNKDPGLQAHIDTDIRAYMDADVEAGTDEDYGVQHVFG
ncbi:hypothetical protein BGX38DRAFT_1330289 [Terfezia claveryi]|nr:hypothetical protein BGX38DRAFT_1330289 [Terfezia claveryi]